MSQQLPLRCLATLVLFVLAASSCTPNEAQDPEATEQGDEEAEALREAAEQGDPNAQFELARSYHNIQGSSPEARAEADRWYHMAAEQGHAQAQVLLGYRSENAVEAVRWYRMAAEQGLAAAQFYLGQAYRDGNGVLKDDAEAVRWYRMAAEQGATAAQFYLAATYSLAATYTPHYGGRGALLELARMWYNIASANPTGLGRDGDLVDDILWTDPHGFYSEDADRARDFLEQLMTRAQIERATELARACLASNYQNCEPEGAGLTPPSTPADRP